MKNNISLFFGILGVLLSVYFYSQSQVKRIPIFSVSEKPTLIVNTMTAGNKIKVIDINGKEIKGEIWSIEFIFYNFGKLSLKQHEILKVLQINLTNDGRILDYRINKQSREDIVNGVLQAEKGNIKIQYTILEKDDFILGQVIYQGRGDVSLEISGALEGVKYIYSQEPINWGTVLVNFILAIILMFVVTFIFLLFIWVLLIFIIYFCRVLPLFGISESRKKRIISFFKGAIEEIYMLYKPEKSSTRDPPEVFIAILFFLALILFASYYYTHPRNFNNELFINQPLKNDFNKPIFSSKSDKMNGDLNK